MIDNIAFKDKLAGCIKLYYENYDLKQTGEFKPSYPVDYTINDDILTEIKKTYTLPTGHEWYFEIVNCDKISDLPQWLNEFVRQFLPRFLKENPMFVGNEWLEGIT